MDESTLIIVAFVKDLMIIVSLAILIMVLIALAIAAFKMIGPIKSLQKTAKNLEEASGLVLDTTRDVSKTFSFFGNLNKVLERIRERLRREG